MISVDEFTPCHDLLSFGLDLQQLQHAPAAASNEELFVANAQLSRNQFCQCVLGSGTYEFQVLAAKLRVRSRPRLEAAHAIVNLLGTAVEIHQPSSFFRVGRNGTNPGALRKSRVRFFSRPPHGSPIKSAPHPGNRGAKLTALS